MLRPAHFLLQLTLFLSVTAFDPFTIPSTISSGEEYDSPAPDIDIVASPSPTTSLTPSTTTLGDEASTEPLPTLAAKLVRLRRQPPYTVVRHVYHSSKRSKPRRRIKRPKYKYSESPSYNFGEPSNSYYKPKPHYSLPEPTSYNIDNLEHLSVHGTDYEVPTNSYEGQSMDLDFYSHAETSGSYEAPKHAYIEYNNYDAPKKSPTYSYKPKKKYKSSVHAPHHIYGLPKSSSSSYIAGSDHSTYSSGEDHSNYVVSGGDHSNYLASNDDHSSYVPSSGEHSEYGGGGDYESYHVSSQDMHQFAAAPSYDMHPLSSYEAPAPSYDTSYHEYSSDTAVHAPPAVHIPATKYGVPDAKIPLSYEPPTVHTAYHPPASIAPPSQHTYAVYDKKIHNSGYSHFAEPPAPAPAPSSASYPHQSSHGNVEISYVPSYEIMLPSAAHKPAAPTVESYQPPTSTHQHSGFGEPPPSSSYEPPKPEYNAPVHSTNHESTHPGAHADYLPPSEELPLNPHHMAPTYDFPKSSYEVPIYDPIPFEASNKDEQESYPPHAYDVLHPGNNFGQAPETPATLEEEATSTQYYDENSSSPAHSTDVSTSAEQPDGDTHLSGSATTATTKGYRSIRKRKRVRNSSAPAKNTKHILDVPELEAAFEANQRQRQRQQHRSRYRPASTADTVIDESNHIESHDGKASNYFLPTVPPPTANEQFISSAWNPMRIRTSTSMLATPATTASVIAAARPTTSPNERYRQHKQNYFKTLYRPQKPQLVTEHHEHNTRQSTPLGAESRPVSILSIDQSRSHSYYDGTLAPPKITMANLYEKGLNKFTALATPTRLPPTSHVTTNEATRPYRTTKSVFDTTYFKSPHNEHFERDFGNLAQNLPKNHKLY